MYDPLKSRCHKFCVLALVILTVIKSVYKYLKLSHTTINVIACMAIFLFVLAPLSLANKRFTSYLLYLLINRLDIYSVFSF